MLLKIKARLIGIWCYRSFRWRLCREGGDVDGFNDPRRFRTGLPSLDVAALDHAQRGHLAHANDLRRGLERDLAAFGPFAVPVAHDFVVLAEAAHTLLSPAIAITCRLATTIEQSRDLSVWHESGQFANKGDRIFGNARMVPTGRVESELDLQGRVIAALPVQDEIDDGALLRHHDLVECCAQYPLAGGCCRSRVRPCARQVGAERDQLLALGLAERRSFLRNHGGNVAFGAVCRRKRIVPAPLQLAGNEGLAGSTASYCRRA